jgi:hypothetical protein
MRPSPASTESAPTALIFSGTATLANGFASIAASPSKKPSKPSSPTAFCIPFRLGRTQCTWTAPAGRRTAARVRDGSERRRRTPWPRLGRDGAIVVVGTISGFLRQGPAVQLSR